jgi:Carboxypeptidase regulatory-like domain
MLFSHKLLLRHFCLLTTFVVCSSLTLAQSAGSTTGRVTGNVRDTSQAVVGQAQVTIKQTATNLQRETLTDAEGSFLLPELPPGQYELTVTATGFKTVTQTFTLLLGTTTVTSIALPVGEASEVIEITAATSVNRDRTDGSASINQSLITNLPINRRDFLAFALTAARVNPDQFPPQGATATSGISFNGQSARFNNVTIDGLSNNDLASGSVRSTFSQDAVQEFQVLADNYSAEFGRALSGVVNIVTKSGGNDYHGSIFLLNRNDKLSARDAFVKIRPPFTQYQFGNTFSGPIKADRAFFFASFERLSINQNNIVTISDQVIASVRRQGFNVRNGAIPFSVGNTTALLRADWQLSANNNLFLRYNFGGAYNGAFTAFGSLNGEGTGAFQRLKDNSIAVNNIYTNPGLNLINETRFLYGRRNQLVSALDRNAVIVNLTLPEGNVRPTGAIGSDQPRQERIYNFVDNVSIIRGKQQIKFGIDYNYNSFPNTSLPFLDNGVANFTDIDASLLFGLPGLPKFSALEAFDPTLRTPVQRAFLQFASNFIDTVAPGFPKGLPLADLPIPVSYVQGFGSARLNVPTTLFSAFLQSDTKLRPNLLIKVGLRYDYTDVKFMPGNRGNFSPRIAFSYRPKDSQKLSLYGSYGVFFGVPFSGASLLARASQQGDIRSVVSLIPFSLIPYNLPGRRLPASGELPPNLETIPQLSIKFQFDPRLRNNYSQQINTGVQYFLTKNTAILAGYTYIRGTKLFATRNINPVVNPRSNPRDSFLFGRVQPDKPEINEFENAFDSYFHSLTLLLVRQLTQRFNFSANYTFSKTIDNIFDLRTDVADAPVNPLRPGDERGLSVQDVRHRFVLSGILESGAKHPLLRNFQLSTICTFTGGRPFNLLAGLDLNQNGDLGNGDRPLIGGVSVGRNAGVRPGFANVDLRLARTFTFKEHYRMQLFIEGFNLFNSVNISEINRLFTPDAQGNFNLPRRQGSLFKSDRSRFVNSFAPRQLQFGMRFSF